MENESIKGNKTIHVYIKINSGFNGKFNGNNPRKQHNVCVYKRKQNNRCLYKRKQNKLCVYKKSCCEIDTSPSYIIGV